MMYELLIPQTRKSLAQLSALLDKAAAFAESRKFDVEVLLNTRLAPDQFHLIRQVQIACDTAKLGAARLTGKVPPAHPDTEKTLADLKRRIADTRAYLETIAPEDFKGAEARKITTPRWGTKYLLGREYAIQYVLPNLYFHVMTAYSILRSNGVEVGKNDYLGELPFLT
ncbi:MAG: DUF1993 domain-containing protein [Bdellovibrionales bacterium]|nr:DUF1993 domain-containing protein [Bdellovibrionales bacterium]